MPPFELLVNEMIIETFCTEVWPQAGHIHSLNFPLHLNSGHTFGSDGCDSVGPLVSILHRTSPPPFQGVLTDEYIIPRLQNAFSDPFSLFGLKCLLLFGLSSLNVATHLRN